PVPSIPLHHLPWPPPDSPPVPASTITSPPHPSPPVSAPIRPALFEGQVRSLEGPPETKTPVQMDGGQRGWTTGGRRYRKLHAPGPHVLRLVCQGVQVV